MAVCPPLSAIETPRISDHEGDNSKNTAPVYSFGALVETQPSMPISSGLAPKDIQPIRTSATQSNPVKGN